jgi:hypothetical protein
MASAAALIGATVAFMKLFLASRLIARGLIQSVAVRAKAKFIKSGAGEPGSLPASRRSQQLNSVWIASFDYDCDDCVSDDP